MKNKKTLFILFLSMLIVVISSVCCFADTVSLSVSAPDFGSSSTVYFCYRSLNSSNITRVIIPYNSTVSVSLETDVVYSCYGESSDIARILWPRSFGAGHYLSSSSSSPTVFSASDISSESFIITQVGSFNPTQRYLVISPVLSVPTPVISKVGLDTITWTDISEADFYRIYKDGQPIAGSDIVSTSYTVTSVGSYQVRAISNDSEYEDSELSNSISFAASPLPVPTLSIENNHLVYGNIDSHVDSLEIYFSNSSLYGGASRIATILKPFQDWPVSNVGYYYIKVNSNSSLFTSSESSFTYFGTGASAVRLATPETTLNNNVLSWQPIDNAYGYVVYKDDVRYTFIASTSDTTSITLFDYGEYTVQATTNNPTDYIDSYMSTPVIYSKSGDVSDIDDVDINGLSNVIRILVDNFNSLFSWLPDWFRAVAYSMLLVMFAVGIWRFFHR